MKVAIVGGAGFLGTRLAQVLEAEGIAHRVFDKHLRGDQHLDVRYPETLDAIGQPDVLVNLAAEHRDDVTPKSLYDEVNVQGAQNLCHYCDRVGIRRQVFTSSVAVYGFAPEGTDETGEIGYFNDYGRTKHLAEQVYNVWFSQGGDRTLVVVRPTVIFGEGNRGNVYNLLRQIAAKRFLMFGKGQNRKSMAYVGNVAEFLRFTLEYEPGYFLHNYVDKPDLTMNELVSTVRSTLFGKEGVGPRMPAGLGILAGYAFDALAAVTGRKLSVSSIRVRKFLGSTAFGTNVGTSGFQPPVSMTEGLRRTLAYEFLEDNSDRPVFVTE